ncbi:TlpA family protein disulfide reductase [Exiguobacterium qingdaonense]|uniref:TlpA family protein disulfide reductase n=1 Tax=Exiguobacterium qingdaonense TaxID=2751251 RepID=UPI001F0B2DBD|nr:TlpA disulfide reductase family protein [Exiguobacterium qingdaonense]
MRLQRIVIGTLILLLIAGLAYKGYEEYMMSLEEDKAVPIVQDETVLGGLEVGQKAPDFTLNTLDGESLTLSQYEGKPVVINFWASWCPPCREEFPELVSFEKATTIPVLGVNVTKNERRGKEDVETFLDEYPVDFPILLDEEAAVEQQYRVVALPTTYVLDATGVIVGKQTGPVDEAWIRQQLNQQTE